MKAPPSNPVTVTEDGPILRLETSHIETASWLVGVKADVYVRLDVHREAGWLSADITEHVSAGGARKRSSQQRVMVTFNRDKAEAVYRFLGKALGMEE